MEASRSPLSLAQKRAMILGCYFECPFGTPLGNCPFDELRAKYTPAEALKQLHDLPESQIDDLYFTHIGHANHREQCGNRCHCIRERVG